MARARVEVASPALTWIACRSPNGAQDQPFAQVICPALGGTRPDRRTTTEADLLGFYIYRSHGHSWRRITRSLIAAKGSISGASYRYLDRTARRGVSYRYRIKAVNRDGTARWFGPVRVT